jgi:hypothetical protein
MDRSPCKRWAIDLLNDIYDSGCLATGIGNAAANGSTTGTANVGTVNGTGVSVVESGFGNFRTTTFTLSGVTMALKDEADTVAYSSLKIYDFPTGYIYIQSAVADLTFTADAAGVTDGWEGDFGLGTAEAAADTSLTENEDDILPTTAVAAGASDKIGIAGGVSTASEHVIFDGTTTAKDLYLNVLVDDVDHNVTATPTNLTAAGTIVLNWIYMGDN